MHNISTVLLILLPLFIGFIFPSSHRLVKIADTLLHYLVFIILAYIGIELSQINDFFGQIANIAQQVALLSSLCIGSTVIALMIFDKLIPSTIQQQPKNDNQVSKISSSLLPLLFIIVGFVLGTILPPSLLPPTITMNILLMLLILMVGISLKGSGISLKEVLINKRGVQISIIFIFSALIAGICYALLTPQVSIAQGLALASGAGWYSLSGVIMTEAYGVIWGSVALFNDLLREIFALMFIPLIMRRFPSSAIGVGGATSLDFTLPSIQQSGGIQVVPLAISFGFIINIVSPLLMVLFSTL